MISTLQDIALFIYTNDLQGFARYHHTIDTGIHGELPASSAVTINGSRRPLGARSLDKTRVALFDNAHYRSGTSAKHTFGVASVSELVEANSDERKEWKGYGKREHTLSRAVR